MIRALKAILINTAIVGFALPEIFRKWPLPFVGVALVVGLLVGRWL